MKITFLIELKCLNRRRGYLTNIVCLTICALVLNNRRTPIVIPMIVLPEILLISVDFYMRRDNVKSFEEKNNVQTIINNVDFLYAFCRRNKATSSCIDTHFWCLQSS